MRLLLDTHFLIWALTEPDRISAEVGDVLEDGAVEVLFSAVSIWEIAIKSALKRKDFTMPPDRILGYARQSHFRELPLTADIASGAAKLPLIHRDPFDRMLVIQAMAEPARLLTSDSGLAPYSELVWLQPR